MAVDVSNALLCWYVVDKRRLPWRPAEGQRLDAYRVWLSEVMLQQTTVAHARPYFEKFVRRWPTVARLAEAEDGDVMAAWAGLGYYARARNLLACARKVVIDHSGDFPDEEAELRKLPGIGDYTAAAIAAIAFGRRALVMDTNVARVVARLHGVEAPISESKRRLRQFLDRMTPNKDAGDFAQAMMDLGATICRPRAPGCDACPLNSDCAAYASGEPGRFPAPKQKTARPVRHGIAYWSERNGCVWLVRRPAKGMLGGMAALPGPDWTDEPIRVAPPLGHITHVFTHFRLELAIVSAPVAPSSEGWWQPVAKLDEAGLPSLYKRAAESVLASRNALAA